MTSNPTAASTERHPWWVAVLQGLGILSLGLLLFAMLVFYTAEPEPETFLDRHLDAEVRRHWDQELVTLSRRLLWTNLGLCGVGLLINAFLQRDHSARYTRAMLVMLCASLLGLAVHALTL